MFERYPTKPPEAPREDLIGEVRIPLVKLHKKLTDSGVKMSKYGICAIFPEDKLAALSLIGMAVKKFCNSGALCIADRHITDVVPL